MKRLSKLVADVAKKRTSSMVAGNMLRVTPEMIAAKNAYIEKQQTESRSFAKYSKLAHPELASDLLIRSVDIKIVPLGKITAEPESWAIETRFIGDDSSDGFYIYDIKADYLHDCEILGV